MNHAQRTYEASTHPRPSSWRPFACVGLLALASACAPPPHGEDDTIDMEANAADLADKAAASLTMESASYSAGQQIGVRYANLPTGSKHWIGLYNATSSDTSYLTWQYASSTGSGTMRFTGLQAGSYEARMFLNDGYQRVAKASVNVGQATDLCPSDPNKTEPGQCGCGKPEGTCSGSEYNVYYGYLHSHTERSDGSGTPAQAYAAAKAAGLDFFSVTDHDYYPDNMTSTDWNMIKAAAAKYDNDPQFVSFWGFEWTSDTTEYDSSGKGLGHMTVVNSDTWCNVSNSSTDTLNELVSWLNGQPNAIALFNHPGQYNTTFDKFVFNKSDKIVGMELWNRSSDYYSNDGFYSNDGNKSYYDEALARGWYIGAGGGQDNHSGGWGTDSSSRIAVLAATRTRAAILGAFQARRFYSTRDKNLVLGFDCNSQPMGSKISATSATCTAKVSDGNGEVTSRVDLVKISNATSAAPSVTSRTQSTSTVTVSFPAVSVRAGDALYVRVYQGGSNSWQAISSPIFVK